MAALEARVLIPTPGSTPDNPFNVPDVVNSTSSDSDSIVEIEEDTFRIKPIIKTPRAGKRAYSVDVRKNFRDAILRNTFGPNGFTQRISRKPHTKKSWKQKVRKPTKRSRAKGEANVTFESEARARAERSVVNHTVASGTSGSKTSLGPAVVALSDDDDDAEEGAEASKRNRKRYRLETPPTEFETEVDSPLLHRRIKRHKRRRAGRNQYEPVQTPVSATTTDSAVDLLDDDRRGKRRGTTPLYTPGSTAASGLFLRSPLLGTPSPVAHPILKKIAGWSARLAELKREHTRTQEEMTQDIERLNDQLRKRHMEIEAKKTEKGVIDEQITEARAQLHSLQREVDIVKQDIRAEQGKRGDLRKRWEEDTDHHDRELHRRDSLLRKLDDELERHRQEEARHNKQRKEWDDELDRHHKEGVRRIEDRKRWQQETNSFLRGPVGQSSGRQDNVQSWPRATPRRYQNLAPRERPREPRSPSLAPLPLPFTGPRP